VRNLNFNNLVAWIQNILPTQDNIEVRRVIFVIISIWLLTYLPKMVNRAVQIDNAHSGTVPPMDDTGYQMLAENILYGFGYSDLAHLPLERYHTSLADVALLPIAGDFYRAPGFPLLLTAVYAVFGIQTLYARVVVAVLIWLSAVLLFLTGDQIAGWIGTIAGGLSGYYYLHFGGDLTGAQGFYHGRLITEPVSVFWMTLFAFLFIIYLKQMRPSFLYLSAFSLVALIFTRASFLLALPLLIIYLYKRKCSWKPLLIFSAITLLPIIIWSLYASIETNRLIIFTTQGEKNFPEYNNLDVITGFGPDRINQGGWQPGFAFNENGELLFTAENSAHTGENGWVKGLQFWMQNPEKLPSLFYVKLRAGAWYEGSRIYRLGIGFLILAIGFVPIRKKPNLQYKLMPWLYLAIQIGMIVLLILVGKYVPYYLILLIWLAMLLIAIIRPYGGIYQPFFHVPYWLMIFIIVYFATALLFGGDPRFHYPIDPLLTLIGTLGLLTLLYELGKKDIAMVFLFLLLISPYLYEIMEKFYSLKP